MNVVDAKTERDPQDKDINAGSRASGDFDLNLDFARTRRSSVGHRLAELRDSPRSGAASPADSPGRKTPRGGLRGSPRSETSSPRFAQLQASKQLKSERSSPRLNSDTEDEDFGNLRAQKEKRDMHEMITDFVQKSDRLLTEMIPLCSIIDSKYAKEGLAYLSERIDGQEILATLDIQEQNSTLAVFYDLIADIESNFIKAQLYDTLVAANVNEKTRAFGVLSAVLTSWEGMCFTPPLVGLNGASRQDPVDELINYWMKTTLSPNISKSDAVNFSNSEEKHLLEQFLQMSDLEILFKLNAYHLPGIGGSRRRNVFESSVNRFLQLFKQVIDHPDLQRRKDTAVAKFNDESAYAFYFLEEIVQVGSIFTRYVVDVTDYICDIIIDGWKKVKDLLMLSCRENPQTHPYYARMEAKINILNKVRQDQLFDEVRSQSPDKSKTDGESKAFAELNISRAIDNLRMRFESFDMERDSWLGVISKVMRAHPDYNGAEAVTQYNEILGALALCIHKAVVNISKIRPLLNVDKRNPFVEVYQKLSSEHKAVASAIAGPKPGSKPGSTRQSGSGSFSADGSSSPDPVRPRHNRSMSSVGADQLSGVGLKASPSTGDLRKSGETTVLKSFERKVVVQTRRNSVKNTEIKRKSRGDIDRSILNNLGRK